MFTVMENRCSWQTCPSIVCDLPVGLPGLHVRHVSFAPPMAADSGVITCAVFVCPFRMMTWFCVMSAIEVMLRAGDLMSDRAFRP